MPVETLVSGKIIQLILHKHDYPSLKFISAPPALDTFKMCRSCWKAEDNFTVYGLPMGTQKKLNCAACISLHKASTNCWQYCCNPSERVVLYPAGPQQNLFLSSCPEFCLLPKGSLATELALQERSNLLISKLTENPAPDCKWGYMTKQAHHSTRLGLVETRNLGRPKETLHYQSGISAYREYPQVLMCWILTYHFMSL